MTTAPASEPIPTEADFRPYQNRVWRLVEGQHRLSTDRLVDTPEEQAVLEALVEEVKPSVPEAAKHLAKLLGTPFRYGYRKATRFRRANERPGIYYAAETEQTAVSETAYYRLKFFAEADSAVLPSGIIEHISLTIGLDCARCLDLTTDPFVVHRQRWTHPADYSACQQVASAARGIAAEIIRYESVRDQAGGANTALFDPSCFAQAEPKVERSWHFKFARNRLSAFAAFPSVEQHSFTFADFGLEPANANLGGSP